MIASAREVLAIIRAQTDRIGVAFSAGKDSHVVLDLVCRQFTRVDAFYLWRVPELEVIRRLCARVEKRYGIGVRMYPHFDLSRVFKHAVLQPHWGGLDRVPRVDMADVEARFRAETGVEWIAYGWRRNDSRSRALIISQTARMDWKARRVYPIGHWRRQDVLNYLRANGITRPPTFGRREQGGVDFHPATLNYLLQRFPDDYAKLVEMYPYAEAYRLSADLRGTREARGDQAAPAQPQANERGGAQETGARTRPLRVAGADHREPKNGARARRSPASRVA